MFGAAASSGIRSKKTTKKTMRGPQGMRPAHRLFCALRLPEGGGAELLELVLQHAAAGYALLLVDVALDALVDGERQILGGRHADAQFAYAGVALKAWGSHAVPKGLGLAGAGKFMLPSRTNVKLEALRAFVGVPGANADTLGRVLARIRTVFCQGMKDGGQGTRYRLDGLSVVRIFVSNHEQWISRQDLVHT